MFKVRCLRSGVEGQGVEGQGVEGQGVEGQGVEGQGRSNAVLRTYNRLLTL